MTNPIIIHSMKTNHPWNDYDRILFYEVTLMDSININKLVKSDVLQFMLNCNDKSGALRKESYFSIHVFILFSCHSLLFDGHFFEQYV